MGVGCIFRGVKGRGVNLIIHLQPEPRLKKRGSIHPLPQIMSVKIGVYFLQDYKHKNVIGKQDKIA
jgi:hypothetical protein